MDELGALTAAACLFRSLGEPARLAILRHLALGEHRVVDLTAHLALAQSTVSAHLACLRDCGLVESRPQGRASVFSLRHDEAVLGVLAARSGCWPQLATPSCYVPVTALRSRSDCHRHPSALRRGTSAAGPARALLAGVSVSYNLFEAVVAVAAGAVAGSVALIGFGLDSLVEVASGIVILWQFRHPLPETRERLALRLIGVSFFLLAAYVTVESIRSLSGTGEPAPSPVGIGLAALSLLIMPLLSWAQRRTGAGAWLRQCRRRLKQTLLCSYLSAVLLAGLLLNSLLGWGWADPDSSLRRA